MENEAKKERKRRLASLHLSHLLVEKKRGCLILNYLPEVLMSGRIRRCF